VEDTDPFSARKEAKAEVNTDPSICLKAILTTGKSMKVPSLNTCRNETVAPSSNSLPPVARSSAATMNEKMPFGAVIMPFIVGLNPIQMQRFASNHTRTSNAALNGKPFFAKAAVPSISSPAPVSAESMATGPNFAATLPPGRQPRKRKSASQRAEEAADRRAKNLASAYRSRERKRALLDALPVEKASLEAKVESLERELAAARAEAAALRDQCACLKDILLASGGGGGGAVSDKCGTFRKNDSVLPLVGIDPCGSSAVLSAVDEKAPAAKGVVLLAVCCMFTVNQCGVLTETHGFGALGLGILGFQTGAGIWGSEEGNRLSEGLRQHGGRVLLSMENDGEDETADSLFINSGGGGDDISEYSGEAITGFLTTPMALLVLSVIFVLWFSAFVCGIISASSPSGVAMSLRSRARNLVLNFFSMGLVCQLAGLPLCQSPQPPGSWFKFWIKPHST